MAPDRPPYSPLLSPVEAARFVAEWGLAAGPEEVTVRPGAFGTVAEVLCGGRRYLLKVVPESGGTAARLARVAAAAEALRAAGFPLVRHRPTKAGRWVAVSGTGRLVARLLDWLPGAPFQSGNPAQIRAAATLLARLHRVDTPAAGGLPCRTRTTVAAALRCEVTTVREKARHGGPPTVGRRRWLAAVAAAGEGALQQLLPSGGDVDQPALCHGDFRGQNVGFRGNEVCALYDVDALHLGDPLVDLAYALVFFPAVIRPRPFTAEEIHAFVDGYARERPLPTAERRRLVQLLPAALLKGVALWLRLGERPAGEAPVNRWLDASRDLPDVLAELQSTFPPEPPQSRLRS